MKLSDLKNKKILILGLGKEGKDNLKFFRDFLPKNKTIGVADKLPFESFDSKTREMLQKVRPVKFWFGRDYLKSIRKYDVIIKTPGIPKSLLEPYLTPSQKVVSQTNIFFENCPGEIIGVTGTKGKGTTTFLIYQILKQAKKKVHLVGNIGKPVLSFLKRSTKGDIFVYELSCHQLVDIKHAPHIAVLLNIWPEHLDYYKGFLEYVKAKENITKHQTKKDYLVFNERDKIVRMVAKKSKARKIPFSLKRNLKKGYIVYGFGKKQEKIIKAGEIQLLGKFNLQNVIGAVIVAKILAIPTKTIKEALKAFKPLPNRLEFVGSLGGVDFYNDSFATAPQAAVEAIKTFKGRIGTVMIGGYDRGLDFKELAKTVIRAKIKNVVLFPPSGERIWQEITKLKKRNLPDKFVAHNMKEAVSFAKRHTKRGEVCLLSPGSASFGIFKDYKERGKLFKKYVKKYPH